MTAARWVIGPGERAKRQRNIGWGLVFSLLLAGIVAFQNFNYPEKYSDVLFWSVVGFVVLANLINYYRYRGYLRKIRDHYLEVAPGQIRFFTGGEVSALEFDQVDPREPGRDLSLHQLGALPTCCPAPFHHLARQDRYDIVPMYPVAHHTFLRVDPGRDRIRRIWQQRVSIHVNDVRRHVGGIVAQQRPSAETQVGQPLGLVIPLEALHQQRAQKAHQQQH